MAVRNIVHVKGWDKKSIRGALGALDFSTCFHHTGNCCSYELLDPLAPRGGSKEGYGPSQMTIFPIANIRTKKLAT